ncbi:hypothetical protein [Haloarcula amylovorans]|uniref:hypothetical protein n=1 Tax=Haloarcula amylovorans TaxID=2562280 RepID=UPI0010765E20|nr:hypothetical protein [Halomicroarcula amylolytica]
MDTPSLLPENEHVRSLLGVVALAGILVALSDADPTTLVPMLALLGGVTAINAATDVFVLPEETPRLGYGVLVLLLGLAFPVFGTDPGQTRLGYALGGLIATCGAWLVFDAYTAMRFEESSDRHEFVSGGDDDSAEVMFRLQTLNVVNQALQDAEMPQSPADLAAEIDLTATRVEPALSYLETKGPAERTPDGYRATPPRWGRLHPIVAFGRWLPRRLFAPLRRLSGH